MKPEPLTDAELEELRAQSRNDWQGPISLPMDAMLATIDALKWQLTCAEYSGDHNAADVAEAFKENEALKAALRGKGMWCDTHEAVCDGRLGCPGCAEAQLDEVRKLPEKWNRERATYPETEQGVAANAAVRLCERELKKVLE